MALAMPPAAHCTEAVKQHNPVPPAARPASSAWGRQWVESYVADNKTFCVYLAKDEEVIRKHAEMRGFLATQIIDVKKMTDPTIETSW